jgi:hypothetical protein
MEHVAVLRHVGAKNRRALTYRPSQRHYVDARAIKGLLLTRGFLADLEQIWRRILKKRNIMHYGHFVGVIILFKIPAKKRYSHLNI